jgi:Na+/proline symporter
MFVALAYFGTDQSQVQRYLTGESVAQSRLGLLFNGLVKVPMQFFILFLGAMVFAFYQFTQPPVFFNPVELEKARGGAHAAEFRALEAEHVAAFDAKQRAARDYIGALRAGDDAATEEASRGLLAAQEKSNQVRAGAVEILKEYDARPNDTNYVFLNFVTNYLPAGVVGLVLAAVFFASMSSTASEWSALASTTVVDIQRRLFGQGKSERYYLISSKLATLFWGLFAVTFAQYAGQLGSLVEAVNRLGSLFYGTLLGIFLLAFYFKRAGGTAAFVGALAGEAVVLYCFFRTEIAFLWYNVIGAFVVIVVALIISAAAGSRQQAAGS